MEKLIQIFVISSTIIEDNLAVMGNAHSYNNDEYYENRIAELERRVLEIEQRVFLKMVHNKHVYYSPIICLWHKVFYHPFYA